MHVTQTLIPRVPKLGLVRFGIEWSICTILEFWDSELWGLTNLSRMFDGMTDPGPDLIKLFWHSITLRQKFKPIRVEYSGHMTLLNQ